MGDVGVVQAVLYKAPTSCTCRVSRAYVLSVQVVPHITDAIQDWIQRVAHIPVDGMPGVPDVCVIELGGTVGDIESSPFVEALRQFHFK
jgi:CTP synthase (UTP-ammonia lyase)